MTAKPKLKPIVAPPVPQKSKFQSKQNSEHSQSIEKPLFTTSPKDNRKHNLGKIKIGHQSLKLAQQIEKITPYFTNMSRRESPVKRRFSLHRRSKSREGFNNSQRLQLPSLRAESPMLIKHNSGTQKSKKRIPLPPSTRHSRASSVNRRTLGRKLEKRLVPHPRR